MDLMVDIFLGVRGLHHVRIAGIAGTFFVTTLC